MTRSKSVSWLLSTSFATTVLLTTGCASLAPEKPAPNLALSPGSESHFATAAFESSNGITTYKTEDGKKHKAEWIACKNPEATPSIFVMHGDKAGFDKNKFCGGWMAQAFLSKGYSVVTVNRPGYGASTGPADFVGDASIEALFWGGNAAINTAKLQPLVGVWGYSSGATAAAFVSKRFKNLKFALLGGGVYDLEETLNQSNDKYLLAEIKMVQKIFGEDSLPDRSIGYDVSKMPEQVILYHGKLDKSAPYHQAVAFRDALASSQYKVALQGLDNLGHEIPWKQHRKIIETLLPSTQKSAASQ
jgi:dipeptidyl aminopeptidase/acylaminoacyl peptidase